MKTYKFTDEAISHIAKALQVALLTGTDITDNLRNIVMAESDEGQLALSPDYAENFDKNIQTMLDGVDGLKGQNESSKKDEIIKINLSGLTPAPISFGDDS